jgi:hypothetical protein
MKSSQLWEVFPSMGRFPIYGRTSQMWADFPYFGRLPTYGRTSHTCKGPIYEKPYNTWEDFLD